MTPKPTAEPEPSDFLHEERARRYTYRWHTRLTQRLVGLISTTLYFLGYDLSAWQIQAQPVIAKAQGMLFVFIRALYGLMVDVKFPQHWSGHRGIIKRGPYLYYRDNEDPKAQAQKLYATCVANGDLGELPPVVDVESINNPTLTASKIRLCVEEVYRLFGDVMIYTGFYVWRDEVKGDKAWASAYKLMIAAYPFVDWKPEYFELVKNYPPMIPAPWTFFSVWQFTSKLPAAQYGVSGTFLDGSYATEAFALAYGLQDPEPEPDPDPEPTGEPQMKFITKTTYTIRNVPNNPLNSKIGTIPQGVEIVAEEIQFTDVNSAWVRINPSPAWLLDPNYTGEAWIAGIHDGQGPFLDTLPSTPCEGVPMTEEQLARLAALETLTATHEAEISALQANPPTEFIPSHRVITSKPGGEKLKATPSGNEAVQVYHGQELMMLNQNRGGRELMAVRKNGVVITGWLDPVNIETL